MKKFGRKMKTYSLPMELPQAPTPIGRTASMTIRASSAGLVDSMLNASSNEDQDKHKQLIGVRITQKKFFIDEKATQNCIRKISDYLGVGDFQVDVWYCSEGKSEN